MITVCRDAQFWFDVANHPAVADLTGPTELEDIVTALGQPGVTPFASKHGGYWLKSLDSFGRVAELHTLFTPEGWGREAHGFAKKVFTLAFGSGCDLIVTREMHDNARSQPPRSFGFRPAGDFAFTTYGLGRTWILTADAWAASPARRTSCH